MGRARAGPGRLSTSERQIRRSDSTLYKFVEAGKNPRCLATNQFSAPTAEISATTAETEGQAATPGPARLVENERYRKVCDFLRRSFTQAADRLLDRAVQPQAYTPEQMRQLRPLVVYGIEASARAGSPELALELQNALLTYRRNHQQVETDKYRLSLLLEAVGKVGPRVAVGAPLEEQWSAARISLAVRGLAHAQTEQILLGCADAAFRRNRHEIVVKCLADWAAGRAGPAPTGCDLAWRGPWAGRWGYESLAGLPGRV